MKPRPAGPAVLVLAIGVLCWGTPAAKAWIQEGSGGFLCTGPGQWTLPPTGTRLIDVRRMCFVHGSMFTNCSGTITVPVSGLNFAMSEAYSSYSIDGLSRLVFDYDSSNCFGSPVVQTDGSWWKNGNHDSEIWWSEQFFNSGPNSGAVEGTQYETCLFGSGEELASDIDFNFATGCSFDWNNSRDRCLFNATVEWLATHEIGHSLPLEHNMAWLTRMNTNGGPRICPVDAGFASEAFGDEFQFLIAKYGVADWSSFKNVTATHQTGTPTNNTTQAMDIMTYSTGTVSLPAGFTYTNEYGSLPGGLPYRFIVAPDSSSVPKSSKTWTTTTWTVGSAWTFPGATYEKGGSFAVNASTAFPNVGVWYRVYVELDPFNAVTEINETLGISTDNLLPLAYKIKRL